MGRAGLKKVVKTVRGKRGTVRRSYWVKASAGKPSLMQRAAGAAKTVGKGALALGAVAAAGALARRGVRSLSGNPERARQAFASAKSAFAKARTGTGADLAHHLANEGGSHLASHFGSRFGQVAGTAIGGAIGGAPGAALGGWVGGQAGAFVTGRHAAPHIARGAEWLRGKVRGNG